jgi:site-specific DNA-methyltransferase (adenine-specific)
MPTWTLHRGDALTVLPELPADSVDAVITDPPYNSGGLSPASRTNQSARGKYVSSDTQHALADFDGDTRDQRGYLAWLSLILSHCYRSARHGGPLLIFCDWRQLPVTSDALQTAGWTWRGIVPWHKPISRPAKGGFKRACEYVLWATKGPVDAARNPVYLPGLYTASPSRAASTSPRSRTH